jgi:hypothetical protein
MYLLEHSILNLDLQIDWWDQKRYFLNANKSERICIYTPTIPVFTSDEVDLLRELAIYLYDNKPANKQNMFSKLFKCFQPKRIHPDSSPRPSLIRCIAIFLYFASSISISISNNNKYKFECKFLFYENDEPIYNFIITQLNDDPIIRFEQECRVEIQDRKCFTTSVVNAFENVLLTLPFLSPTTTPLLKIIDITQFCCRHASKEDTLINMLKIMKLYLQDDEKGGASGGRVRPNKKVVMKKTKRVYQVRKSKGKEYIMMNKKKVFLCDIKGTYTLQRD